MEREGKFSHTRGLAPGTLIHVGKRRMERPRITIIDYDRENFVEKTVERVEECFPYRNTPTITWINIDGLHDVGLIEKLGKEYGLHPLIMEDILDTTQRPKLENLGYYLFFVTKMLYFDGDRKKTEVEQVSILLGDTFVLSFQERIGDVFEPIRKRLKSSAGELRSRGSDYLVYCLLDAIVDNYFTVLEKLGEEIEFMEEELVKNPTQKILRAIHRLKRELIIMRRAVWPLREMLNQLERIESPLIKPDTRIYLRDLYDHTIQVIDTIETFREMVSGMLDIYLSSINNKMNEIMKVLTIIGTIFLPLTFITGIYGMNFRYMPELYWRWGYFAVLGFMLVIAIGMLLYFKKKKWL